MSYTDPRPEESLAREQKPCTAEAIELHMQKHNITPAKADRRITRKLCLLLLRILKRLSMSVENQQQPAYPRSALYFMDKLEDTFGRNCAETTWTDSHHVLDAMQSNVPSNDDLRIVCENLYVMQLRGARLKGTTRGVAEHIRSLLAIHRIPATLIPKLPKYKDVLKPFSSLTAYHTAFPAILDMNGEPVTAIEPDTFAQDSLTKLTLEILVPMYDGKKMQALSSTGISILTDYQFVSEVFPEVERLYALEWYKKPEGKTTTCTADGSTAITTTELSADEVLEFQRQHKVAKELFYKNYAEECFKKNMVLYCWTDKQLLDKIICHPYMNDMSVRLFYFNAGVDCTKTIPKKSVYLLKSELLHLVRCPGHQ